MTREDDARRVIIAGAGPVGCTAALILAQAGIPVTLLEAEAELPTDMRASTFHPPTVDMLDTLGLTERLMPMGLIADRYQYRDRASGLYAEFNLRVLDGLVKHPYRMQVEQFRLTREVVKMLADYPHAEVRMSMAVERFHQEGNGVVVEVTTPSGPERIRGRFLIGCDGSRSVVRKQTGVEFEGFTYPELFLVISTDHRLEDHFNNLAHVNYVSDPEEWCTILRVPDSWRVLFPTDAQSSDAALTNPDAIEARLQRLAPKPGRFNVFHVSLYRIHQRVAKNYRFGSVLLAGDAAHLNNPLGGMGMNGGIHDVFNLCAKLKDILDEGASEDLLDLYDRQRRTVTVEYIQAQTIQNKKTIEEADGDARLARIHHLRSIAADRDQAITFLRRQNMLDAIAQANAIT